MAVPRVGKHQPNSSTLSLSQDAFARLAETFAALADPNRVRILCCLIDKEMCVTDLGSALGVSESAVSQHLRILRALRWVKNRRQGRTVFYSLSDKHVQTLLAQEIEHLEGR